MAQSADMPDNITPKDAATLILVCHAEGQPRLLMGRRAAGHVFMPGKWVFPGGRVDPEDYRVPAARELRPDVADALARTSPTEGQHLARALALAAVRETFEETGLVLGAPLKETPAPAPDGWQPFFAAGYLPNLAPLSYIGRAITPLGHPRRFDTRFLMADAGTLQTNQHADSHELLDLAWLPFDACRERDLIPVTRWIIDRVEMLLAGIEPPPAERGHEWRE